MRNKTLRISIVLLSFFLAILAIGCSTPVSPAEPKQTREIIQVYVEGGSGDNVGAIKIAEIRIDAGKINITTDYPDTEELRQAIAEIEARPGLALTFENMEDGKLMMYAVNVTPEHPEYIHALRDTLQFEYGIRSVIDKEPI
jgi:hypothetical protein